jgi:SAM-dependent methyltransferase
MEVMRNAPAAAMNHPNKERWKRARSSSRERGTLVVDLLAGECTLPSALVLDLGAGVGGTSISLIESGAVVISIDLDIGRLRSVKDYPASFTAIQANATLLPFPGNVFDIVILQDVVEHVQSPHYVFAESHRVLKRNGILYVSTPNKYTPLNIIADPHWGLPFAALMKRRRLKRFLSVFRPDDARRNDLAELFSFHDLTAELEKAGFSLTLKNALVIEALFQTPRRVVWSDFHLALVRIMKELHLQKCAKFLLRNPNGFFNRWVAPAWYIICRKCA